MSNLFVTCLPGLEGVLQAEIVAMGLAAQSGGGGVWVKDSSLENLMRLNLSLRTATRVLLPVLEIAYPSKKRLYQAIYDINLSAFFRNGETLCIDVPFAKHPDFNNTHFVAQLVKDAICDQLKSRCGSRPSVDKDNPGVRFSVVVMPNKAILYFDSSGEPLFKRGYRADGGEAPLKENLAAALLMLAGYTGQQALVDPCCGAGTFLIEAALLATHTPPGVFREEFGFFKHPAFREDVWKRVRTEACAHTTACPPIFGIEKDGKSYVRLRKAILRTGLQEKIETFQGEFQRVRLPTSPSLLICNPPFGVRLGQPREHIPLYRDLGAFMKTHMQHPGTAAVLSTSVELLQMIGMPAKKTTPVTHGGLDCFFSVFELD